MSIDMIGLYALFLLLGYMLHKRIFCVNYMVKSFENLIFIDSIGQVPKPKDRRLVFALKKFLV